MPDHRLELGEGGHNQGDAVVRRGTMAHCPVEGLRGMLCARVYGVDDADYGRPKQGVKSILEVINDYEAGDVS